MPHKPSSSGIYKFQQETLPNRVYSSTTFGNKNIKKYSPCCLASVFSVLLMGAFMSSFSLLYIANNDIAYYENVESDTIMQPGFHLYFMWKPEKLKFASTKDTLLIPMLSDFNSFTKQNITVDYTVINTTTFVKSLQKNDKNCIVEITTFVQNKRMETPCIQAVPYDQVYEIPLLINTTISVCGITITNATFPKDVYNTTEC